MLYRRRFVALPTNLVRFRLRWTGSGLQFLAEPAQGGPQGFLMHGLQFQRLRHEGEALQALERAGVGSWSSFPSDNIEATVTREQLMAMGFRGNY